MASSSEKQSNSSININHMGGKYFVWDSDHIFTLRTKHRVCGQLVGSLPWKPWQSNTHSAPLILLPSEAHFCYKNGIAKIVDGRDYFAKRKMIPQDIIEFKETRLSIEKDQIKIFKVQKLAKEKLYYGNNKRKHRKGKIDLGEVELDSHDNTVEFTCALELDCRGDTTEVELEVASSELESKPDSGVEFQEKSFHISHNEKLLSDEDLSHQTKPTTHLDTAEKNTHTSNSTDNVDISWKDTTLSEGDVRYYNSSIRVHIPTNSCAENSFETFSLKYPITEEEKCCCVVYEDMHRRGFSITSGMKFGGDFLVYLGDPLRHHSHYIILVLEKNHIHTVNEMVTYGRLAAAVKKTVVLATLKEGFSGVDYLSLTWAQMK